MRPLLVRVATRIGLNASGHRPERNPLEFCFCFLMAFSVTPVALGLAPLPNSLVETPTPFGRVAAAMLVLGSLGVMAGIAWRNRDTGLLLQQAAMWMLGFGLLGWGFAVLDASSWTQARIALGLSFGVALGCFARIVQFQTYIHSRGLDARNGP